MDAAGPTASVAPGFDELISPEIAAILNGAPCNPSAFALNASFAAHVAAAAAAPPTVELDAAQANGKMLRARCRHPGCSNELQEKLCVVMASRFVHCEQHASQGARYAGATDNASSISLFLQKMPVVAKDDFPKYKVTMRYKNLDHFAVLNRLIEEETNKAASVRWSTLLRS